MAATLSLTTTMRSGILDSGINAACGTSPILRIYGGAEPANASAALSGNTLLATLTLSSSPFGAAASGVVTAAAITSDSAADATGTATFARLLKSDATTVLLQGNCGTSAATFVLNTVAVVTAAVVSCSAFTVTLPAA